MLVVILHPTEQLKITNLQKEICTKVNSAEPCIFPTFPLWFPLTADFYSDLFSSDELELETSNNNLKTLLKNISKKIDKLSIDIFQSEQKEIPKLRLNILTDKKTFTSEIPLYQEYKSLNESQKILLNEKVKKLSSSESFPMSLKIFRIAKAVKLSEKSQGLQAFVWMKIK